MKNTRYLLATLVLVLIIVYAVMTWQKPNTNQPTDNNNNPLDQNGLSLNIKKVAAEAFGSLTYQAVSGDQNLTESNSQRNGVAVAMPNATNAGGAVDGKMIAPDSMLIYQPTYYQYVYQGDEFSLNDEELAVLKRIKPASPSQGGGENAKNNFGNFNLGLLNLNSFADAGLNNFNIVQDKKFGYSLYINLFEGSISLSENWAKWYDTNYAPREFKNTDIPADDAIIALTDNFLAEHDIDAKLYGQPEVQKNNYNLMLPMAKAEDTAVSSIYPVSNSVSVIYPLLLDGKQIYDDWGNKQGLQLNVNLEFNKVSSLYNLNTQNYQSSNYKMETDKEKILKLLRNGSIYPYYNYQETDTKIVEIPVGTPKLQYVRTWQYKNNINDELLVPALVFPILNPQNSDNPYKTSVVIPLAKDIIDQAQNQDNGGGPIRVMGGAAE
ncbi:MAG: hypothetical protein UR94_C0004G0022 [Parcubacteria group bacterium GW2011_GWA2_36_10]|nr:MAG: hypothetical protein UR94_C0004G0022 [Parcubacteria group bacterium GW2011_GWA2_36_10]